LTLMTFMIYCIVTFCAFVTSCIKEILLLLLLLGLPAGDDLDHATLLRVRFHELTQL